MVAPPVRVGFSAVLQFRYVGTLERIMFAGPTPRFGRLWEEGLGNKGLWQGHPNLSSFRV